MINPLHIQTLREVLRVGSFANAARNLGYTSSAVSQQISALEHKIGVALFERSASSVQPTHAARVLACRGNDILASLESLRQEMQSLSAAQQGRITLGSFPTASQRILPTGLASLSRMAPEAEVHLDEGEPDELLPPLLAGKLDLVLVYSYDLAPRTWPDAVVPTALTTDELVLLVPESHPFAGQSSVRLADLSEETWIASREETAGARALVCLCTRAGFIPRVAFRSNDYDVVRGFVRAKLGIALVPRLAHRPEPGVRDLRIRRRTPRRQISTLHRDGNPNPLLRKLIGCLLVAARTVDAAQHGGI
ncbi:LysR family transcriptional regulator [Micromonospora cremea]|uniref:DNA-binding transcriptional regulator, LysR family n=1 Tax=Micromonospora cremea TaxID=709881 RepID=A0A1N5UHG1_9ACTN|nr:LysR family transcriptional regulator [Micromonospora cremea]SIM59489.1 DNA-binding transcriptional regulator, LysR family [Micromonospora cremea]